jgi:hypothetical protein
MPLPSVNLIPSFEFSQIEEKIFVVFHRLLFGKLRLFDDVIDRAAVAVGGTNGIILILFAAISIVSSLRLSSHSFISLAENGTRRIPWVYR